MAKDNSGGLCCVQGALVLFNVITLLGGVGTIAIGVVLLYESLGSLSLDDNLVENAYNATGGRAPGTEFYGLSIVLIALGSLVTFVSFLGCCGAFVSSRCLLMCYLTSVAMILTLQLIASIFAILYHQPMKDSIRDELTLQMRTQYQTNSSLAVAWDFVQGNLQCCGVDGYTDWFRVNSWPEEDIVPDSCCRIQNYTGPTSCGRSPNQNQWNKNGCFDQIQLKMREQLHIVASAILAVVFLQLYGIIASILLFYHAKSIRRSKAPPANSTPYKSYSYERAGLSFQ